MRDQLVKKMIVTAAAAALCVVCAMPSFAASKTRLDTPDGLYWSATSKDDDADYDEGSYAKWDEVDNASKYELTLYCEDDNGTVKTMASGVTTRSTKYNFRSKMTQEGDYYFRVRAIATGSSHTNSYWSDYSDTYYVSASAAENAKNGEYDSDSPKAVALNRDPGWTQDEAGFKYMRYDGTWPANGWFQDPGTQKWYYLDESGYMRVGFIEDDGHIYYCDPAGDPYGAMVTGSIVYDGVIYNFDESGALVSTGDVQGITEEVTAADGTQDITEEEIIADDAMGIEEEQA